ncbi:hypothetical protein EVAR_19395_1 [Eumeta japonica]|uniref:PiggyBac transposable element-derived protein domain-containing protein n=1 Tax=Eumeta variegata TaxID=151549 RepID=A0A4C1TRH5_EUMVA|nr:hypothetical protein EVAR_19395_1 [Eumeta japonica]
MLLWVRESADGITRTNWGVWTSSSSVDSLICTFTSPAADEPQTKPRAPSAPASATIFIPPTPPAQDNVVYTLGLRPVGREITSCWVRVTVVISFPFGEGAPLTDNYISELLNNGDVSEIEDFDIDEDDFDLEPNILFALAAEEDCSSEEQDDKQDVIEDESSSIPESVVEPLEAPIIPPSIPSGRTTRTSRQGRSVSVSSSTQRSRVTCGRSSRGGAVSTLSTTRRRVWKQVPFEDGPHNYMPIPTKPVRRPVDYFRDYFDDDFIEKISHCTNLYYLRSTGRELKCTSTEITKLLAIHIIMGCVPYPPVAYVLESWYEVGFNLQHNVKRSIFDAA